MKYGFGVDLGGTTVKIAFFDEQGTMLAHWEIPTDTQDNGRRILPDIAGSVLQYLEQQKLPRSSIIGVGIGVPGPVNRHGVVNRCINLGWGVFNIEQALSDMLMLPVKAGNDANVAALGEFWKGSGKDYDSMVFVTLGTGVGGGIIIDGRLLYGAHGSGAEIGHLVLNRAEPEACNCGNHGCVEQYCSATGIVRLAGQALSASETASLLRGQQPLTCKAIFDAGKAGDVLAQQVLAQYYAYLGEFLANVSNVVDPEIVVLGGGVSKAGPVILDGLLPHYNRHIFHGASGTKFALASLSNDAGSYGAFKLILDNCCR